MAECIFQISFIVLVLSCGVMILSLHKIEEGELCVLIFNPFKGHVGVYYRGGALLSYTSGPGFHMMLPLITTVKLLQIMHRGGAKSLDFYEGKKGKQEERSDAARQGQKTAHSWIKSQTQCITRHYDHVSRFLPDSDQIDDYLKRALQEDLTVLAPGLYIQAVRVTKPEIPQAIRLNYESVEKEKTKLMIAVQHQKVIEQEAETERKKAVIEAEKQSAVEAIEWHTKLLAEESKKQISAISDSKQLAHAKSLADAEHYRAEKEAASNRLRLTPAFLELSKFQALAANSKIYFTGNHANLLTELLMSTKKVSSQDSHQQDESEGN